MDLIPTTMLATTTNSRTGIIFLIVSIPYYRKRSAINVATYQNYGMLIYGLV
jgi:hypothetical protein